MQWEKNTPAPAMAPNREEAGEEDKALGEEKALQPAGRAAAVGPRPLTTDLSLSLPSQRSRNRAINSLDRSPPVLFSPSDRRAITGAFAAFVSPLSSLTLLDCQPFPNLPRSSSGTWRVLPILKQDWFSWPVGGRGKATPP